MPSVRSVGVWVVQDDEPLNQGAANVRSDCRANLVAQDPKPSDKV